MIQTAPLRLFRPSPLNVRKTVDPRDIAELADSIERHGLLQNLDVVPAEDMLGTLDVVAGGQRLRALHKLLDEGRGGWTVDSEVPYLLVEFDDARDVSLEENRRKVALNPADEIEAFAEIVAEHTGEDDPIVRCARRHGVSERYVEQQLRLVRLAPEIMDALRDGTIGLPAARAYASVDDHAAQRVVFEGELRRAFGPHNPRNIREALAGRTIPASDARALYVGIEAYRAAGGRVDRDLFLGADAGELLLDPAILDGLAREKAEAELAVRVQADRFTTGLLTASLTLLPQWPKTPAGYSPVRPDLPIRPDPFPDDIGVYTLRQDGSGLVLIGYFVPARASAAAQPAAPAADVVDPVRDFAARGLAAQRAVDAVLTARRPVEETADQVIARYRERDLQTTAAHLVIRRLVAEHRLEERLQLPAPAEAWDEAEPTDDGDFLVSIQVRVSAEEVEAMRAAAAAELAGADDDELPGPDADEEFAPIEGEPEMAGGGGA